MTHTIVNHENCAGRRFSLSRQKIELILIHKSVTHRHNNNIKRSRTHTTPLAQRQSAGLIILRSADQNPQEVVPGVAQRLARVAHNHEVIRSKRIAGIRSARPQ